MVSTATTENRMMSVTHTEFARATSQVLEEIRERGRTVFLTRRGRVTTIIEPRSHAEVARLIDLDDTSRSVSIRDLSHPGPGSTLESLDEPMAITHRNVPFALMTPAEQWTGFDDVFADVPEPGPHVAEDATTGDRRAVAQPTYLREARSGGGGARLRHDWEGRAAARRPSD